MVQKLWAYIELYYPQLRRSNIMLEKLWAKIEQ